MPAGFDDNTLTMQITELRAGQQFEHELRTSRGLLVLGPGEPVSAGLIARLSRSGTSHVLLTMPTAGNESDSGARAAREPAAENRPIQSAQPRPEAPDPSEPGAPRSASGQDAEREEQEDRARRRAARRLWEYEQSQLRVRAGLRKSADDSIQGLSLKWGRLALRVSPVPQPMQLLTGTDAGGSRAMSGPLALELHSERDARVRILQRVFDRLLSAERVRVGALIELVEELMDLLTRHADRFAAVAMGVRRADESVAEHAYATGALSVAIAARMGWSAWDVRLAGLAGMLADCGMLLLHTDLRDLPRPLTEIEWNTLRRHPAYSVAMCCHLLELPEIVPLAAYQHHERSDGSGYPMGLKAPGARNDAICDLAKVIGVADVLAAATSLRAHRPRLTPHGAVRLIVQHAGRDQLDKACVRAAVAAVGVFPAGSFVRLSSGQIGLVEGLPDSKRADRPVVRLVEATLQGGAIEIKPEVVDLSEPTHAQVSVVEALDMPELADDAA